MDAHLPPGCLLLHGFTGEPFDLEPLAGVLVEQGFSVSLPLLPGHGTTIEELDRTGWEDWAEAVVQAYDELAARCGPVFVVGFSLGGSLGLELALRRPVAGLACLAAPLRLYGLVPWRGKSKLLPFVPLLRHVRPLWPSPPKGEASRAIAPWRGYEGIMPLNALHSLMRGLTRLRRRLGQMAAPLLVVHCATDCSVDVRNAFEIRRLVGSAMVRLELLDIREEITSHHMLPTHIETRDKVADLVSGFFDTVLSRDEKAAF